MNKSWHDRLDAAGFSSLEAMISLVVVSVGVLGSGAAMVTSARITVASQQEIRYWAAVEYQAETLVASETLAAASAGGAGTTSETPGGSECDGLNPDNPELSVSLSDVQMKQCYYAMQNQSQRKSDYDSDLKLNDAATGQVLLIVDKPYPKGDVTKDTVVVYLHDGSS